MKAPRLDLALVERGLAESREKAQRLILAGKVRVKGQVITKAGAPAPDEAPIEIEAPERFVSRGGEKLEAALAAFPIEITGRICLDAGASTGGFTDCLLQRGATKVYAVDVGRAQLHERIRTDPRVVVHDQLNVRYLTPDLFPEPPTFACVDVSFIALTKVLPAVCGALVRPADLVTLIKPQFEAGREQVGPGGVVRDPAVHEQVIKQVRAFGEGELGLRWCGLIPSPLLGPAGNREFLAHWQLPPLPATEISVH